MYPIQTEEAILKALVRYHYLTYDQVMLSTGQTSKQNVMRRLKHLLDMGYVWRIHQRTTEQSLPIACAYTISNKSKVYLEKQGHIILPPREPSPYMLEHSLAINDVLIQAELLTREYAEHFKLLHLEHDRDLKHRNPTIPLIPDGFFEIADLTDRQSYPVLIEVDLETEARERWQTKIEKYLALFGEDAKRVFDFEFPTVAVFTKPKHLYTLKEWTEAVITKRDLPDFLKLFYFAPITKDLTPDDFFLSDRFLVAGRTKPEYLLSLP